MSSDQNPGGFLGSWKGNNFVAERYIKEENREKIRRLQRFAGERGQSLAQLGFYVGAQEKGSHLCPHRGKLPEQIGENVKPFFPETSDGGEQEEIDRDFGILLRQEARRA